jgi:hypothetical protein
LPNNNSETGIQDLGKEGRQALHIKTYGNFKDVYQFLKFPGQFQILFFQIGGARRGRS